MPLIQKYVLEFRKYNSKRGRVVKKKGSVGYMKP